MTAITETTRFYLMHEDYLRAKKHTCPSCAEEDVLEPVDDAFTDDSIYSGGRWECTNCGEQVITLEEYCLMFSDAAELLSHSPIEITFDDTEVMGLMDIDPNL